MSVPRPPADVESAVATVRRRPLRWLDGDSGASVAETSSRGWFLGASECTRVLAASAPLEFLDGRGFGGAWPALTTERWLVAPALPVVVGDDVITGVDGDYGRRGSEIRREAVGVDHPFWTSDRKAPPPGAAFDLLWFSDHERYVVRDGVLEIDDLFSRLTVSATRALLEMLLIRRNRIDAGVLSDLAFGAAHLEQIMEVRRPTALSRSGRWRDPVLFLNTRADVDSARRDGDGVEARTATGSRVVFDLNESESGWTVNRVRGNYPLTSVSIECAAEAVVLRATIDPTLDALTPGLRGRFAFDLRSDLVALG